MMPVSHAAKNTTNAVRIPKAGVGMDASVRIPDAVTQLA